MRPRDEIGIFTTERPNFNARVRPLTPKEDEALREFLEEGIRKKWIRKSASRISSGMIWVPKKNGKLRPCVDYRRLNAITRPVIYAPPNHYATRHEIGRATWFAKFDLKDAFYRMTIREEDRWKTAFATKYGRYEFNVMEFGLVSGPGEYQMFIENILHEFLGKGVTVYLDDILIFTTTRQDTQRLWTDVQDCLRRNRIPVNWEKSSPPTTEIEFCGHHYRHGEIRAIYKSEAVETWPTPKGKRDLQKYLGLLNCFRDFVEGLSKAAEPLYAATARWSWGQAQGASFQHTKELVTKRIQLAAHDPLKPATMITDASGYGLAATLWQNDRITAIISRKLTAAERNYDTAERELLAVIYGLDKWKWLLEVTPHLLVKTDNNINATNIKENPLNRRKNRWIAKLMQYNITWQHTPGKTNIADYPSRRPDYL